MSKKANMHWKLFNEEARKGTVAGDESAVKHIDFLIHELISGNTPDGVPAGWVKTLYDNTRGG